jgi:hypothetical protein
VGSVQKARVSACGSSPHEDLPCRLRLTRPAPDRQLNTELLAHLFHSRFEPALDLAPALPEVAAQSIDAAFFRSDRPAFAVMEDHRLSMPAIRDGLQRFSEQSMAVYPIIEIEQSFLVVTARHNIVDDIARRTIGEFVALIVREFLNVMLCFFFLYLAAAGGGPPGLRFKKEAPDSLERQIRSWPDGACYTVVGCVRETSA